MEGKIEFIGGVMYSGKSTFLVDKYIDLLSQGKTISAYKPIGNKRGGNNIVSRDREFQIPCNLVMDITEALETKADIVFIDEGQNFNSEQLKHTLKELQGRGTDVFVAGLQKNCINKEFENFTMIKNLKARITILSLKCEICKTAEAEYSCLIKWGKNKTFSTTAGAEYKNTCNSCGERVNVIRK